MTILSDYNSPLWQKISETLSSHLNSSYQIQSLESVTGGDISEAFIISGNHNRFFVKLNSKSNLPIFEAEQEGLKWLDVNAPACICIGHHEKYAFLVLEYLPLTRNGSEFEMGGLLAKQHQRDYFSEKESSKFGWYNDNYIGTTPQANNWKSLWHEFWIQNRMIPQLELAHLNGYSKEIKALEKKFLYSCKKLLFDHHPKSALLHGDLWRGNAGFANNRPVFYDPACYFGDRETDLALTELFGGFSSEFYQGYNDIWPIEEGYKRRKTLYNLYHLLNHLNLFGSGYLNQVTRSMSEVIQLATK